MKKAKNYVILVIGVILLITGLYLVKTTYLSPGAFMTALPYVCIGVGCGAFGHGMGNIISNKIYQKILMYKSRWKLSKKTSEM